MATTEHALALIPENAKAALAKLPQTLANRIGSYLSPEMLAVLEAAESPEEAMEMLQVMAQSAQADANAPVSLPVYTIQHQTQKGVAKKWLNPDGDTVGDTLHLVVLLWGPMRGMFLEGRKAPICSAKGAGIGRGKAAPDASEALNTWAQEAGVILDKFITWDGQEHDCATCPFNDFGSDLKGRSGKACKEKDVVLFVLVRKEADGTFTVTEEGFGCNVPTTSRKPWQTYVDKILRQRKVNGQKASLSSIQVITGFKLSTAESDVNSYAVINPELVRPLTPDEFRRVMKMQQDAKKIFEQLGADFGENYDDVEHGAATGSMGAEPQFQTDDDPF